MAVVAPQSLKVVALRGQHVRLYIELTVASPVASRLTSLGLGPLTILLTRRSHLKPVLSSPYCLCLVAFENRTASLLLRVAYHAWAKLNRHL
jgi:hypothetical protein